VLARYFIERPVLANVIALFAIVIGAVALLYLPVAQYPPITPPTVQVAARYPGANAQTVVDTVALPIEQQVNGVEKMLYMQSTAANDGTYALVVTFAVGTDLDQAQVQVQNRISAAMASLPDAVQALGVVTKKKSTAILQIVTLTSPDKSRDSLFLSNYATISLKDTLSRIPGVGDTLVFGIGQYSMRVWLDPEQMKARALTPADVIAAIQQQSQEVAAGQIGAPPAPENQAFQFTLDLRGRFATVAQFEQIAVKTQGSPGGAVTRIRDVGRVELGAQTYSQFLDMDGQPAAGIAVFQLPDANALDVGHAVEAEMKRLSAAFPSGIAYSVPFDTTRFVHASINEVYTTLVEAAVLVLLVIVVFLQSWRATLVPATTVPVTIIGAFAAMAALGFSVNLLTLFALVLAIGIVVDDAIIVVEGAAKYVEEGIAPKQAATLAMNELLRPILAITLVLLSVFLPASILPGIVGQLYRQFALVIAATAVISAINAVTLKPTQCALWLRPQTGRPNAFYRGFNLAYDRLERGYAALVRRLVGFPVAVSLVAVALAGLAIWSLARLPTAFIPTEDQGYLLVGTQLPDGASLERTQKAMARVTAIARNTPGVEHVVTVGGASLFDNSASLSNAGIAYVILKDWSKRERGEDPLSIYKALQAGLDAVQEASSIVVPPPPIQGLGLAGGFQMQVQVTDGTFDYRKLQQVADRIVELGNAQPALMRLMTPFRASAPQLHTEIDRRQAEALSVNVGDAFQTIQTYLGSTYVSQFSRFGHNFPVFVQADTRFRLTFEALGDLNVRNSKGAMVPVGTLARVVPGVGPALIPLFNLNPSATINGTAAPGFSSGQALKLMEEIATATLPPGMSYGWTGVSYQEAALGNQSYWIFALALLLVLMVLAGQYESWSAPLAVVVAVPLALLGTVAALAAAGAANNIYTQIGLVLLIALSSKNAILIVEFARELRLQDGHGQERRGQERIGIEEAAVEASRVRFRPILMTSIAFILGVLPLVFATGAGAAARRSIGITVFSGMLASTCIAILFAPALFVVLQRWSERRRPISVPNQTGAA
jgi:hydrophobic/amphiphilic exporter-1 (mainly G- bacteria), HAE1 family